MLRNSKLLPVAIATGFRGPSNHDPHISRLQTQTRLFTPLSCDIEPEITKPIPRKIFASSDLATDPSDSIGSRGVIAQGLRGPFLLNSYFYDFEKVYKGRKITSQLWLRMAGYQNYVSYTYVFISSSFSLTKYAGR